MCVQHQLVYTLLFIYLCLYVLVCVCLLCVCVCVFVCTFACGCCCSYVPVSVHLFMFVMTFTPTERRQPTSASSFIFVLDLSLQDIKLGRNVARTFLDYYKFTGYISTKPSSGLNPKPDHHGTHHNHHHHHHRDGRAASEPMRNTDDRYGVVLAVVPVFYGVYLFVCLYVFCLFVYAVCF